MGNGHRGVRNLLGRPWRPQLCLKTCPCSLSVHIARPRWWRKLSSKEARNTGKWNHCLRPLSFLFYFKHFSISSTTILTYYYLKHNSILNIFLLWTSLYLEHLPIWNISLSETSLYLKHFSISRGIYCFENNRSYAHPWSKGERLGEELYSTPSRSLFNCTRTNWKQYIVWSYSIYALLEVSLS